MKGDVSSWCIKELLARRFLDLCLATEYLNECHILFNLREMAFASTETAKAISLQFCPFLRKIRDTGFACPSKGYL